MDYSRIWVVIAAFNEGAMIAEVIKEALLSFKNIVVVDDGSKDNTVQSALVAGATVLKHPVNLGQGAALQTGIDYALQSRANIIITFDADGQHRVQDAVLLAQAIDNDEADIACGSRFLAIRSDTMPFSKKLTLKLAAWFTRLTSGVPVTDAHNGLRALSSEAASKIRITQNRMAHASEIISEIKRYQLRFKEYPVEIIYTDYSIAKGQRISNSINILIDLLFGRISK